MDRPTVGAYRLKQADNVETLVEVISNPEFAIVAIFCAIGLLITLNVMLRLPDLGTLLGSM